MSDQSIDQFYTRPGTAELCCRLHLPPILSKLTSKAMDDLFFVEPSAGEGSFYRLLPRDNRVGIDIAPNCQGVTYGDFLKWRPSIPSLKRDIVVVGNPPFGKRGVLAVKFFQKATEIADTIAFIVPVIFRKFFIHKQLPQDLRWIYGAKLPRGSFYTNGGREYEVNTEFQVWTRLPNSYKDRRLFSPPPICHEDFDMWQYNNTEQALNVFENEFDFAVPCQGWQDYTRREIKQEQCEKTKQWMLFRTLKRIARERLWCLNYEDLAYKNTTSVPGFRKGDLVQEYVRCFGT